MAGGHVLVLAKEMTQDSSLLAKELKGTGLKVGWVTSL
jgi:hypothetical protein